MPIYGTFKNDADVAKCYLLRVCNVSRMGFDMKKWVDRVISYERNENNLYLLSNEKGVKDTGGMYQPYLFSLLTAIQKERNGLIPIQLEVEESFGVKRSFRRGSVTDAGNVPNDICSDEDIERNNRWRKVAKAGTRSTSLKMIHLYTDTLHSTAADLRFSTCL